MTRFIFRVPLQYLNRRLRDAQAAVASAASAPAASSASGVGAPAAGPGPLSSPAGAAARGMAAAARDAAARGLGFGSAMRTLLSDAVRGLATGVGGVGDDGGGEGGDGLASGGGGSMSGLAALGLGLGGAGGAGDGNGGDLISAEHAVCFSAGRAPHPRPLGACLARFLCRNRKPFHSPFPSTRYGRFTRKSSLISLSASLFSLSCSCLAPTPACLASAAHSLPDFLFPSQPRPLRPLASDPSHTVVNWVAQKWPKRPWRYFGPLPTRCAVGFS